MVIVIVGIIVLISGVTLSFPQFSQSFGVSEQEDVGIFSDQFSIAESFVPFRTVGEPRTTLTSSGDVVEAGTDFTGAIDELTAKQATDLITKLPDECRVKLFTTVVFEDDTKQHFSSGFTSFQPVSTLSLISPEGQPIKRFETVPLMTCDVIIAKDGSRIGYINQWLFGVNINWEFIREDGSKGFFNTASQGIAGGTSTAPKCTPVLFEDVGDLATAGYSSSEIQNYKDTFGFGNTGIFIGSERALCAKDAHGVVPEPFIIQASEIENGKGNVAGIKAEGKEFETTLTIIMTGGTIILEVPFLSDELGKPFIAREALDQFLSREVLSFTVDNLVDIPPEDVTPPPTGVDRTIVTDSFSPTKIDVALLSDSDRTVTWRIKLNSYDNSEGVPKMEVRKVFCINFAILDCTAFGSSLTASIPFKDAGFSGTSKIFEVKWVVLKGQTLGTYELSVSMPSRDNSITKKVEIVQSAKDAPSREPNADGTCGRGEQIVQDKDDKNICVAECADNLLWDLVQQACAEKGFCPNTGKLPEIVDGGKPICVEDTTAGGLCREGLTFNSQTEKCEGETKTQIPVCKDNEQLVNLGGGKTGCQPKTDFLKFFKIIACTDKIGFTDEGFCVPPTVAGILQNPLQIVYIGIGFIVFIVVLKFLINSVNRTRGGIVLSN